MAPRSRATRRRIRRLVVDLERRGGGQLETSLRRALGDDALSVAFWLPERGCWADSSGHDKDLTRAEAGRAVTHVQGPEGPLAALIHDTRVGRDGRLLEAVVAAARLALENERLEADLRARIIEVRASRRRVVATGDAERRRIERDLHDGAQQRLLSLSLGLQIIGMRLGPGDHGAAHLLEQAAALARGAVDELRTIAHGMFPAALADEGLAAALENLAAGAPVVVQLEHTPQVRASATAEAAVYFAAVEAVDTAARQDADAHLRLSARIADDQLTLTVERTAGDVEDLRSLELDDRVDAVGGTVTSAPGWLRAEVPVNEDRPINAAAERYGDVETTGVDTRASPPRSRHPVVLAGLAVAAIAVNALWLLPMRGDLGGTLLALDLLVAGAFAAAGAVALRMRPGNPTGAAMLALALFVNLGDGVNETVQPWRYTIGLVFLGTATPLLALLAVAFPTGRVRGRGAALLCVALSVATVCIVVMRALWWPPAALCATCPPAGNLLFVGDPPFEIFGALNRLVAAFAILVGLVMATLLARWVRATAPGRRALAPIVLTTVLLTAKVALDELVLVPELLGGSSITDWRLQIIYPNQLLTALIPVTFLLAVARSEFGRSPLAGLLAGVVDERAPLRLDQALATALRDPSLRLGYRMAHEDVFVDLDGRRLDVPDAGAGSRATFVGDPAEPFAVIVHDAALAVDERQLEAASAAAGMTLRRERLRAELRARLVQLSQSRERLIHAVDDQRTRMEHALQRGVQARLAQLQSILDDLRGHVDDAHAVEALDDVTGEVRRARSDLRSFVRAVRPAAVAADGLAAAVHALARSSPVPATVTRVPDRTLPDTVEAAVWFVCSEALVNVAKHARASHAHLDVHVSDDGVVHVTVTDDGVGGAAETPGSGLRGLRDRVTGLGGTLSIASRAGSGTTVRATVPAVS